MLEQPITFGSLLPPWTWQWRKSCLSNLFVRAVGIYWVESRNTAKYPALRSRIYPITTNYLAQNISSTELEHSCCRLAWHFRERALYWNGWSGSWWLFSLSYLSTHRSQCLSPRPTELSFSLEQSGHRPQPDLYLWATMAGRVYCHHPWKARQLGRWYLFKEVRRAPGETIDALSDVNVSL